MKLIKLSLISGNLRINTQPARQIDLLPSNNMDPKLIPTIKEFEDYIEISGQKSAGLVPQKDRAILDILLPEGSEVYMRCLAGTYQILGKYSEFHANIKAGTMNWHPSGPLTEGSLRMWTGQAKVLLDPEDEIKFIKNTVFSKEALINGKMHLFCTMGIGDLQIRARKGDIEKPKYK